MIILKLNYYALKLLNSKYKVVITLLIYLIIIYIYTLSINNIDIADCMMRANSFPSLQADKHLANNNLEFENFELSERIISLEKELQATRDFCLTERVENEHIRGIIEENQRYLINENRQLRANLLEAEQTIGKMAGENVELRTHIDYQRQYIKALNRNLETFSKHIDDLSTEIEILKANLATKK